MNSIRHDKEEICLGCVYFPPNLPAHAYSEADYSMLQQLLCSYEFIPGEERCHATRKTSCSIVDLQQTSNESI